MPLRGTVAIALAAAILVFLNARAAESTVPLRLIVVRIRPEGTLEHGHLPDPEGQAIDDLARRVAELEAMVRLLAADNELERPRKR